MLFLEQLFCKELISGGFLLKRKSQEFSGISKACKAEFVSLHFTANFPESSKYLQSSIVVALQPVDCKPVTLVKRELLEELEELLCGTNTNTKANTKFLFLLY